MDPYYFTRYAMAGWILAAVVFGSALEQGLLHLSKILEAITKGEAGVIGLLLGVVVGVGAPPAIGFLLERVSSFLLVIFRRDMWQYPCCREFVFNTTPTAQDVGTQDQHAETITGSAAFHIFFYSHAPEELIAWSRRRRMQLYASLTSFMAIAFGLLISCMAFDGTGTGTLIVSLLFAILLAAHAYKQQHYHMHVLEVWSRANTSRWDRCLPRNLVGPVGSDVRSGRLGGA